MSKPDYQFLYMMAIAQMYGIRAAANSALEIEPEHHTSALKSIKALATEHIETLESKEKHHEPI